MSKERAKTGVTTVNGAKAIDRQNEVPVRMFHIAELVEQGEVSIAGVKLVLSQPVPADEADIAAGHILKLYGGDRDVDEEEPDDLEDEDESEDEEDDEEDGDPDDEEDYDDDDDDDESDEEDVF